jgi:hypothetical protein
MFFDTLNLKIAAPGNAGTRPARRQSPKLFHRLKILISFRRFAAVPAGCRRSIFRRVRGGAGRMPAFHLPPRSRPCRQDAGVPVRRRSTR